MVVIPLFKPACKDIVETVCLEPAVQIECVAQFMGSERSRAYHVSADVVVNISGASLECFNAAVIIAAQKQILALVVMYQGTDKRLILECFSRLSVVPLPRSNVIGIRFKSSIMKCHSG